MWLPLAGVVFFSLVVVAVWRFGFVRPVDPARWWPVLLLPLPLLPLLYQHFRLRRLGARYDAEAVALTGDPEALLTALAKLARLGLLPLSLPREKAPPGHDGLPWRRLEALAERANIPPDRLEEILAGPGTGSESYAPLPPAEAPDAAAERVFSPAFRQRFITRLFGVLNAVALLTPALVATAAQPLNDTTLRWTVYLGGAAATFVLHYLLFRVLVPRAFRRLRRRLAGKLEREGISPGAWGGVFVGLSPGPSPRLFEGFYDWDLGFLFLAGDRLCYVGEQTRFAIRREQLADVRLGAAPPSWRRRRRLTLTWHDKERGTGGTWNLRVAETRSPRGTADLARRLQEWWRRPAAAEGMPAPLAGLPAPGPVEVAGTPPRVAVTPRAALSLLARWALMAAGLSYLAGLSFHPWDGAAWYVILVPCLVAVWRFLPHWLYREPAATPAKDLG
jgi:hypothetical protein